MGVFDFLFGEGPSVDTQTLDTLTPEQQQSLNQLLNELSGGFGAGEERRFGGDVSVDPSNLSQISLSGLEERALALADPSRESAIGTAATDSILKLLDFESADAGIEDFFRTNIRDPALQSFQEDVLPSIGRDFGGSNFFGSERQGADEAARSDLLQFLTQSRSGLAFNARESDRNRALQALGLAPGVAGIERGDSAELQGLFGIGTEATGLSERNVEREFAQFLSEAGLDDAQVQQLLAGINTQSFENVVTTNQGSSGLIPAVLSALGGTDLGAIFKGNKATSSISGKKDNTSSLPPNSTVT